MNFKTNLTISCFLLLISLSTHAQSIWAESVINFKQGTTNFNNQIASTKSNPEKSLGDAANISSDNNEHFSLGFGGEITIKLKYPVKNINGPDLKIWESSQSPCTREPEKATIFASQDGCNFLTLGSICQTGEVDLGELNWALYIKILDISPRKSFVRESDGYDVNAIEAYVKESNPLPTNLKSGFATTVIEYLPQYRRDGTPITSPRTNPRMALGVPQGTDSLNFVSLGFGGTLILGFDFVKFNQPGWDLQIIETTFNNPLCENYPERVQIEVSKDLRSWEFVDVLCLDGYVDVKSTDWFKYIRLSDRSRATRFTGSADGYDVDGILVFNDCTNSKSRILVDYDDVLTPDEEFEELLFPNPFEKTINLNFEEKVQITIMDYSGRRLQTIKTQGKFDIDLEPGYYYFEVLRQNGKSSMHKLVRK